MIGYGRCCRGGKTHNIMRMFKEGNDFLLVSHNKERGRIIDRYILSPEEAERVLTWDDDENKIKGSLNDILIDDVDLFLRYVIGRTPKAATFTGSSK